jgi:positive regulator of sigma E activity
MGEVAGTVVEVRGGQAIVECSAEPSGCSLCQGGRGCRWQRIVGRKSLAVPAMQPEGTLQRGDPVMLAVDDARLLAAAARLYLPPLVGLLLAPALLRAAQLDEGFGSLFAAALGLAAGLLVARRCAGQAPAITVHRQSPRATRS